MNILALDTATTTGWAVSASGVVTSGVFDCSIRTTPTKKERADHPGLRFDKFSVMLHEKLYEDKIDLVVYEMVVGGRSAGGNTSMIQKGLEAFLYREAYRKGCPVWSFAAATIKKWATGSGVLTHESKAEVVRRALAEFKDQDFIPHRPTKSQPWTVDDNQCDALWILDLAHRVHQHAASVVWPPSVPFDPACPDIIDNLTPFAHRVTSEKWNKPNSKSRRR